MCNPPGRDDRDLIGARPLLSQKCSVRAVPGPAVPSQSVAENGEDMPTIADAEQARLVTGGVDTHAEVHVVGMVDHAGRVLGTREFPVGAAGYQAALAWMRGHGELVKAGVEGTGSYGAGLARYLAAEGAPGDRGDPAEPAGAAPPRQISCRPRRR